MVPTIYHGIGLWYYDQSRVTELLIMSDLHYDRLCLSQLKPSGLYILNCEIGLGLFHSYKCRTLGLYQTGGDSGKRAEVTRSQTTLESKLQTPELPDYFVWEALCFYTWSVFPTKIVTEKILLYFYTVNLYSRPNQFRDFRDCTFIYLFVQTYLYRIKTLLAICYFPYVPWFMPSIFIKYENTYLNNNHMYNRWYMHLCELNRFTDTYTDTYTFIAKCKEKKTQMSPH